MHNSPSHQPHPIDVQSNNPFVSSLGSSAACATPLHTPCPRQSHPTNNQCNTPAPRYVYQAAQ
eukprot:524879-Pelagomonas_calceolata.AAC.1